MPDHRGLTEEQERQRIAGLRLLARIIARRALADAQRSSESSG